MGIEEMKRLKLGIWGMGHSHDSIGYQLALCAAHSSYFSRIVGANRSWHSSDSLLEQEVRLLGQDFRYVSASDNAPDINSYLENLDILVVLVNADKTIGEYVNSYERELRHYEKGILVEPPHPPSRYSLLEKNLEQVVSLGEKIQKLGSFHGLVINVSNPLDILTYALLASSGLPASKVAGFNLQDRERMKVKSEDLLRLQGIKRSISNCYTCGPHDNPIPLTNIARIGHRKLDDLIDADELRQDIRNHGNEVLLRTGHYAPTTAHLLLRFIETAVGLRNQELTASMLYGDVCVGMPALPARHDGLHLMPHPSWQVSDLSHEENGFFQESYSEMCAHVLALERGVHHHCSYPLQHSIRAEQRNHDIVQQMILQRDVHGYHTPHFRTIDENFASSIMGTSQDEIAAAKDAIIAVGEAEEGAFMNCALEKEHYLALLNDPPRDALGLITFDAAQSLTSYSDSYGCADRVQELKQDDAKNMAALLEDPAFRPMDYEHLRKLCHAWDSRSGS